MRRLLFIVYATFATITPAFAAGDVQFITFGDWGSGSHNQQAVADAATRYCKDQSCGFVLTLGDNFYEFGVKSTYDPKWKRYYKDIYKDLHLPFYAVIGNHDEFGSVQAQIDYHKVDPSWNMPGEYYSIKVPSTVQRPVIEIFVINNADKKIQAHESQWLEDALAHSEATWKILAMHEPIISNGEHGDGRARVNDALVPIICGKVDLVLSGHNHSFSHLKGSWAGCAVDQMIVGTGGKNIRSVKTNDPRVLATGSFFGFGWFSATPKQLTFRMIKTDGSIFYETTWKK